jgi:hypothetical protein
LERARSGAGPPRVFTARKYVHRRSGIDGTEYTRRSELFEKISSDHTFQRQVQI